MTRAISMLETLNGTIDTSTGANFVKDLSSQVSITKSGTYGTITSLPATYNYTCYKNTTGACNNGGGGSYWVKRPDLDGLSAFVTKDGSLYMIRIGPLTNCDGASWHAKINSTDSIPTSNMCLEMTVDVNGDKKPNMVGVDLHTFVLLKKDNHYYLVPAGNNYSTFCSNQYPNDYNNSLYCTVRMLQDMDMP